MSQRLLVTSALPYANGSIHLGHLVEYIQTDVYVRFRRACGDDVTYVCAADSHGTPIEVNAAKAGMTPKAFVEKYRAEQHEDFKRFGVEFSTYYTTDSARERALGLPGLRRAQGEGAHLQARRSSSSTARTDRRFLPDRFVKGTCPKCGTKDQYGDVCEVCGTTYDPRELMDPRCAICGTPPIVRVVRSRLRESQEGRRRIIRGWVEAEGHLEPAVREQVKGWLADLQDWCITRDAPYFGFPVNDPEFPGKFLYVWVDAPIGYLSSAEHYFTEEAPARPSGSRRRSSSALPRGGRRRAARALHRQGHPPLPRRVLAGHALGRRPEAPGPDAGARPPHRERREDVEVARDVHHRAHLPRLRPRSGAAPLLLRGEPRPGRAGPRPRRSTSSATASTPTSRTTSRTSPRASRRWSGARARRSRSRPSRRSSRRRAPRSHRRARAYRRARVPGGRAARERTSPTAATSGCRRRSRGRPRPSPASRALLFSCAQGAPGDRDDALAGDAALLPTGSPPRSGRSGPRPGTTASIRSPGRRSRSRRSRRRSRRLDPKQVEKLIVAAPAGRGAAPRRCRRRRAPPRPATKASAKPAAAAAAGRHPVRRLREGRAARRARAKRGEGPEGADKLLKLTVDAGDPAARTIVAGHRAGVPGPAALVGKRIVVVANLAPRPLRGHHLAGHAPRRRRAAEPVGGDGRGFDRAGNAGEVVSP